MTMVPWVVQDIEWEKEECNLLCPTIINNRMRIQIVIAVCCNWLWNVSVGSVHNVLSLKILHEKQILRDI